jgi:hypothetical protein
MNKGAGRFRPVFFCVVGAAARFAVVVVPTRTMLATRLVMSAPFPACAILGGVSVAQMLRRCWSE